MAFEIIGMQKAMLSKKKLSFKNKAFSHMDFLSAAQLFHTTAVLESRSLEITLANTKLTLTFPQVGILTKRELEFGESRTLLMTCLFLHRCSLLLKMMDNTELQF